MKNNNSKVKANKIHVLVIDDDKMFSEVLTEKLQINGFNATYALSGKEGLEMINSDKGAPCDIVICDLSMPKMNGDIVFKEIQKIDPYMSVIMLTGKGSTQTAVDLMGMGVYRYFSKPLHEEQYEELFLTIKKGVTRSKLMTVEEKVLASLELDVIFDYLIDAIEKIFAPQESCLALIEKSHDGKLITKKHKGLENKKHKDNIKLEERGFVKTVIETKKQLLVPRITKSNRDQIHPFLMDAKSLLAVPLTIQKELIGILEVEGKKNNNFTDLDLQSLERFGRAASLAIHYHYLNEDREKMYKEYISAFNSMTHQFKTPLYKIQLKVSTLLDRFESINKGGIKDGLNKIYNYSEDAEEMIRNVLLNYKDEKVEISLPNIIDKTKSTFETDIKQGITINWPMNHLTEKFLCKRSQIMFVFHTIIENAIDSVKLSGRKDGKLNITSRIAEDMIEFEFNDNGMGIKNNYKDKILNVIFSTKPDDVGNGIGLFLSKSFVIGNGGDIWIGKRKKGNTSFHVTLPLKNVGVPYAK